MPDALPTPALINQLRAILGPTGILTDPADTAPHSEDWRRLYRGQTPAVLRPATTEQLAACVAAREQTIHRDVALEAKIRVAGVGKPAGVISHVEAA